MVRTTLAIMTFFSLMVLSGCFMDDFFGLKVDEKTGEVQKKDGPAPADKVGSLSDRFVPGSSLVLMALGGLWAAIRGHRWKAAFVSTAQVIENAAAVSDEVKAMKETLSTAHVVAGVQDIIKPVIDRLNR